MIDNIYLMHKMLFKQPNFYSSPMSNAYSFVSCGVQSRTHGAAVKLFYKYLKDIGGHVIPPILEKWVNDRSRLRYGGGTHGKVATS